MLPAIEDLEDRKPIWDVMQMVWMDTDVNLDLPSIISVSSSSKYSVQELEEIYWNEVRPAVWKNLLIPVAPDWAGYDIECLSEKILTHLKNGKKRPKSRIHFYAYSYWKKIEAGIKSERKIRAV